MLAGCTSGSTEEPDGGPRRDLAATPLSLPPLPPSASASVGSGSPSPGAVAPSGSTRPTTSASGRPSAPGSVRPSGAAGSPSGSPGAPAAPFRTVGSVSDRRGDAGTGTPAYADLTAVTIEDDGTQARVTVRFAGPLPTRLPAEETMGVGVDLFRTRTQIESDYQLFADGQPEGWFAYLHTPDGFVKYQGTFGIGGDRLVFTVPWSALGSPTAGTFKAFADWTRTATPVNLAGEDFAPELANEPYAR